MKLDGSCHCGAVRFSLGSHTPYPFNRCYCSICRKTQGGGGYVINIMGDTDSLHVEGSDNVTVYRAVRNGRPGTTKRHFCRHCGSGLWIHSDDYPQWVYPFASAIDTPLPKPPDLVHLMLRSRPDWVPLRPEGATDVHYEAYPASSIESWHRDRGLYDED